MSRAFTREPDGNQVADDLPERPVSQRPNWVTPTGLRQIEERIHALEQHREQVRAAQDQTSLAAVERDLRYWLQRRASAQVVSTGPAPDQVRFGVRVTLRADDGSERDFKLVGEDEADPATGLISWAAPVAQALLGHEVGEDIELRGQHVKIVACATDPAPPP